jgi:hypothetical protein
VVHDFAVAEATEHVDLPTLHSRLGHASPATTRPLVRHHAMKGVELIDDNHPLFNCDSCDHAKMTRRAIRPEQPGPPTTSFGEERVWVHNSKGTKLGARGVMGRWVGYDRDSPHVHRISWPEKHSTSVERDVKLITDALIIHAPPAHSSATPPATTIKPRASQPTATTTPDDGGHKSPEQASAPDSGAGEPPGPATPDDEVEQVGADEEPPSSPLTSLPRTPSPRQPPPLSKKPKTSTALPVRQSTWVTKPPSYVWRLAKGEGSTDGRGGMTGGIPDLKRTLPGWQERQERSTDSEQAYTAELDDAAAAAIGDAHGPKTS